jgi:hypothetical protein
MKSSSKLALVAAVVTVCGLLTVTGVVVEGDAGPPVPLAQAASPAPPAPTEGESPCHTPPENWAEPRNFHTPFMNKFSERFFMRHDVLLDDVQEKDFSPNKGYWYGIYMPDTDVPCPQDGIIYIHVERDYSLRVVFRGCAARPKVNWINEKLLYVEVWWSDILGSYLILDVEREQILTMEMIQNGRYAYEQTHRETP